MIEDRDRRPAERLEVPVTRIGGPSAGADRRNRLAALAVVVFALGVVGLALPGALPGDAVSGSARPSGFAAATAVTASPSPTTRPRRSPRPSPTVAPMPSIETQPLPGAPRLAFYKRTGDDVEILAWTPDGGGGLEGVGRIEAALAGIGENEPIVMTAAPDGRSVLIQSFGSFDTGDPSPVVLATLDRGVLWTSSTSETGQPIWSEDSRWVVFGTGVRWYLIDTAADPVAVREVLLGGPRPAPSPGSPIVSTEEPVPIGISHDGAWAYGVQPDAFEGGPPDAVRVGLATGVVEAIDAIPRTGPQAPPPGYGLPSVDPATGRYVEFTEVGNRIFRVHEPSGAIAFEVDAEGPVQAFVWLDDGRLAVIVSDAFAAVGSLSIFHLAPDGSRERPAFELENAPNLGLVTRDRRGHAIMAVVQERNDRALLIMVRLRDGAAATLDLDLSDVTRIHSIGWLDPAGD